MSPTSSDISELLWARLAVLRSHTPPHTWHHTPQTSIGNHLGILHIVSLLRVFVLSPVKLRVQGDDGENVSPVHCWCVEPLAPRSSCRVTLISCSRGRNLLQELTWYLFTWSRTSTATSVCAASLGIYKLSRSTSTVQQSNSSESVVALTTSRTKRLNASVLH